MTKEEAIELANSKPRNEKLQYFVIKWNDGYAIVTSSYIERNPQVKYVYKTEGIVHAEIKDIRNTGVGKSGSSY